MLEGLRSVLRVGRNKATKLARRLSQRGRRLRERWWVLFLPAIAKRCFNPHVTYVGVTGSSGKTTTATMIGAVLSAGGECISNVENNDLYSLGRSVLSVLPSTKFSVHEICGASPGKIRRQTRILRPDIGVITLVGRDHYKIYRTPEATANEKGLLAGAVPKHGTVILNADDPYVRGIAPRCRGRVMTFGISPDAEVRGIQVSGAWPDRLALTVVHGNQSVRVASQMVGEHWATSVLAAVACGLDLKTCADAISRFEPPFGRYSVHQKFDGAHYVLDNKAVDWTIAPSLAFLAQARAPRKTIVFGTISDYPGKGGKRYRAIARRALQVADRVVFVGPQSGHVSKLRQGEVRNRLFEFQTAYETKEFLEHALAGELILVKGSRVDHLERLALLQTESVVCWREACRIRQLCPQCRHYRTPKAAFGLAETRSFSLAAP